MVKGYFLQIKNQNLPKNIKGYFGYCKKTIMKIKYGKQKIKRIAELAIGDYFYGVRKTLLFLSTTFGCVDEYSLFNSERPDHQGDRHNSFAKIVRNRTKKIQ